MCLSGILKDILLIFASTLIWSTQLTGIQILGYGAALFGLFWYKQGDIFKPIEGESVDQQRKRRTRLVVSAAVAGVTAIAIFVLAALHDWTAPLVRLGN